MTKTEDELPFFLYIAENRLIKPDDIASFVYSLNNLLGHG
jgi:hypothetical protein